MDSMVSTPFLVFLVLAVLVGCVPFGDILLKQLRRMDTRQHGSGNLVPPPLPGSWGASWILRVLVDTLKGAAAAWLLPQILWLVADLASLASITSLNNALSPKGVQLCMGIAALLGHCCIPFLGFKGGNGVAMALGVLLVVSPGATGGQVLGMTMGMTTLIAVVVVIRHWANIERLLKDDDTVVMPFREPASPKRHQFKGFIYVLSNPSYRPNLLKIGHTYRAVEERVRELNSKTAVPTPFTIEGYFPSTAPRSDEKVVHEELSRFRTQDNKEFFKCDVDHAFAIIEGVCKSQVVLGVPAARRSRNQSPS